MLTIVRTAINKKEYCLVVDVIVYFKGGHVNAGGNTTVHLFTFHNNMKCYAV